VYPRTLLPWLFQLLFHMGYIGPEKRNRRRDNQDQAARTFSPDELLEQRE